jgi:hypothetical protein
MNYFFKLAETQTKYLNEMNFSIIRFGLSRNELPNWKYSEKRLTDVKIMDFGLIEDYIPNTIQLDFANKFVGIQFKVQNLYNLLRRRSVKEGMCTGGN